MESKDIKVNHLYSSRFPRRAKGGWWNDRRVISIVPTIGGMKILYRSPAVVVGHPFEESYSETVEIPDEEGGVEIIEKQQTKTLFVNQSGLDPDSLPASMMMTDFLLWVNEDVTHLNTPDGWRK